MGLGNIQDPNPKKRVPNFDRITPLEIEMKICCEFLHCTHSSYIALSSEDKVKLLLYEEMTRRRSNDEAKRSREKIKSPKSDNSLQGKRK